MKNEKLKMKNAPTLTLPRSTRGGDKRELRGSLFGEGFGDQFEMNAAGAFQEQHVAGGELFGELLGGGSGVGVMFDSLRRKRLPTAMAARALAAVCRPSSGTNTSARPFSLKRVPVASQRTSAANRSFVSLKPKVMRLPAYLATAASTSGSSPFTISAPL